MKKSTATIENITPPTDRDLGGVSVCLVEVTFRLDEHGQSSRATHAYLEGPHVARGVSDDTGMPWKQDWSKSVYPIENGLFVAALPADSRWKLGKSFSVVLSNVSIAPQ